MFLFRNLTMSATMLAVAAWAVSPFCDTQSLIRNFTVDSVAEFQYTSKLIANLTKSKTVEHHDLSSVTALTNAQDFQFLSAFPTSCKWTKQTVQFAIYPATVKTPIWHTLDSVLWTRYMDGRTINSHDQWIAFLPDTAGWEKSPTYYSDAFLYVEPIIQWYAYAVRLDTLTTNSGKTISIRSTSSISVDSASLVNGLFDDWIASEPLTDHAYSYQVQIFKVFFDIATTPPSITISQTPARRLQVQHSINGLVIRTSDASTQQSLQLLDLHGRVLTQVVAHHGEFRIAPKERGVYIARVLGFQPQLVTW